MKEEKVVQVFVGSPGDVADERKRAFAVIESINRDPLLPSGWRFEGVGWDQTHYPKIAWLSPQEAINQGIRQPGDCDIAVFIFWKRIGTPLPPASFTENKPYWGNHFWAKGYCVDTVGIDADMIRKYVKYQEKQEQKQIKMNLSR